MEKDTLLTVSGFLGLIWMILPIILGYLYRKLKRKYESTKYLNDKLNATVKDLKEDLSKSQSQSRERLRKIEGLESFNQRLQGNINKLGDRLIKDNFKFAKSKLTSNNFVSQKGLLSKAMDFAEKWGFDFEFDARVSYYDELKEKFEDTVRKSLEKEEQAKIKAKIREEQQREKEILREEKRLESERTAIERALEKALKEATNQHSEEIEALKKQLEEATSKQRALSQAQLTKTGHVYIISNIGAFGENIFKIGMTRRLEPMDRVKELGDASVPFPFDVHAMISCENAPELESKLHKAFDKKRVNRVNLRKEFFTVSIDEILSKVEEFHGKVEYQATPEALEYHQSVDISEEDYDYLLTQAS